MKLSNIGLIGVLGSLGVIASSISAQALDFNWSFIDDNTGVPVTGTISGLSEGPNDVGSQVITVTSTPSGAGLGVFNYSGGNGGFSVHDSKIVETNAGFFNDNGGYITFSSFGTEGAIHPRYAFSNATDYTYYDFTSQNQPNTFSAAATAVPFDFNPTEGAALGLPLFIGLGMLRKKKLAQKSAAKKVAELVS